MLVWMVSLPALVVLLTALAVVETLLLRLGKAGIIPWRRKSGSRWVSSTGFEVLQGHLSAGKAQELKQRHTSLMLREDEEAGARPNTYIDLDEGTATIRLRNDGRGSADRAT
jgi:hypothetical protein